MYEFPYGAGQQLNLNWIINEIITLHKQLDPDWELPNFDTAFPYTNLNTLNLDWILRELKAIKDLAPAEDAQLLKMVANALIANTYDATTQYNVDDIVYRDSDNRLYKCITATPAGGEPFDSNKWLEVDVGEVLTNLLVNGSGTANAVTNVRYNNHKIQQEINGTYSDVITIEDAPTNNSDRLPSSKALYKLILESTNDTTDRTSEILAMLTNNKKCVLGAGTFYTTGIDMPDGSTLCGMGDATVLHKTGSGSYVINMNKNNVVESLCIDGNDTVSSTKGTHHGILWEGNFSTSHDSSLQPKNGKMSNITIKNCNGGGITCNNTGTGRDNNVLAINVAITNCNTGINIPYYSEYHKFTNIDVLDCYIGCLNNGGNNTFISCDFSNSKSKGFVIDNSNNDRNNNAHGSAIGCFFNHIASDNGTAIEIIKINNGFVFSGCQIFYGNIIITDSYGVEVTDSVFGSCSITITNGGGIVFAEDTFSVNPTVSITNNVFVYFRNCTNRSAGYYIPETGQAVLTAGTQWNFPCVSGYLINNVITLLVPITAETASTKDITTTSLITTLVCADGTLLTNNEEDVSYINYVQLYSAGRGLAISLKKTNGWGTNLTRSTVSGQVKITTTEPIK